MNSVLALSSAELLPGASLGQLPPYFLKKCGCAREGGVYTPLESFYTEGQGDGLGPSEMAVDHLLFKFNEEIILCGQGVKQSLLQKVQLWCCVCSTGLRGYPRWPQAPCQPSGGGPISDVKQNEPCLVVVMRSLPGGVAPLALPSHTWAWGRCRVLHAALQYRRWPWLHNVRGSVSISDLPHFNELLFNRASLALIPVTCRN